jgi:hypothetical protein
MYLAIFWNPLYKSGDFLFYFLNSKSEVLGPVLEQQSFICVESIFFRLKNEKKTPTEKTLVSVW